MKDISRRDFIRWSGLAGLGLTLSPPPALAGGFSGALKIHRESRLMMGTYVTLTVLDESSDRAAQAGAGAIREMERLAAILTRFDSGAPLAHLARTGNLDRPDPELAAVLLAATGFYQSSGGHFDVTVAPLVDGQKKSFEQHNRPLSPEETKSLLKLVDGSALQVLPERISLLKEGMALTLDGLGKGYIVDQAGAALKKAGIKHALINAGGDILALGGKGDRPWRIGVLDPTRTDRKGPVITLKDQAVATSGNYEVYWDTEKLHHHIIDPGVGDSPSGPVSVSIKSQSCLEADALSTTLFCLPARQALAFMAEHQAQGLIINNRGERISRGVWS